MLGFLTGEDSDRPIRRVGHGQQELHLLLLVSPVSPSSLQGQNYSVETCEILGCSRWLINIILVCSFDLHCNVCLEKVGLCNEKPASRPHGQMCNVKIVKLDRYIT